MSELQSHRCMASEQWTWLLFSVGVTPENKLSLQQINELNGNLAATSGILEMFGS